MALLLGLCGCGQNGRASSSADALTWQEQYDLGVRYLSEGNYQAAIIAFAAAIEIDPKRPEAFVGRGDAYVGMAQLSVGESTELPEESRTAYESAVADYLSAIGLNKLLAAVYGKVADVYLALGDTEAAAAILEQGYEVTGVENLRTRAETMREDRPEGASETVTVEGVFISGREYYDLMDSYVDSIQEEQFHVHSDELGVRFSQPVEIEVDSGTATIREALLVGPDDVIPYDLLMWDYETQTNGPLIGKPVRLTGYFYRNELTEEFSGPISDGEEDGVYYFRPFGDYVFYATGCEVLS